MTCYARHYGDQIACGPCAMTWDRNDPDPPACGRLDARTRVVKLAKVESQIVAKGLPVELPRDVEALMQAAYYHGGMKAAYRVLLDRIEQ